MLAGIINVVLSIVSVLVGVLPIPDAFVEGLDSFLAFIIDILSSASWLIPMDLLILCLGIVWAVDNYKLIFKFVMWLIERIPFIG